MVYKKELIGVVVVMIGGKIRQTVSLYHKGTELAYDTGLIWKEHIYPNH